MKKIISMIFVTALIMSSFSLRAENDLENYLLERGKLVIKYDSLKTQIKDSSLFEIKNLAIIQSAIINEDNFIINEFQFTQGKYDELANKNTKLTNQLADKESELADQSKWLEWGIYAGGALLLLFLVVLILFIVKSVKNGKLKKQIKSLEQLLKQYQEQLDTSNKSKANDEAQLTEIETAYNQIINENKAGFEKEINSLNEKLSETQKISESLKDNIYSLQQEKNNLLNQVENLKNNAGSDSKEEMQNLQQQVNEKENEIAQLKEALLQKQQQNELAKSENNNEELEFLKNKIIQLEKELESKEADIIEAHKFEKTNLSSEIDNIKQLLDEEKRYNEELKRHIDELKNENETLKNNSNEAVRFNESDISTDSQTLIEENNSLKLEVEEYKKIIDQELEFRKDILKLMQELKK